MRQALESGNILRIECIAYSRRLAAVRLAVVRLAALLIAVVRIAAVRIVSP